MDFKRIGFKNGLLDVTEKKDFEVLGCFDKQTIEKTFDFAYDMSFGAKGAHKNTRSSGTIKRKNGEIFANTFQGKLSEFAVYNQFHKEFNMSMPNLSLWGQGKWDNYDALINGKKISIKSTVAYGNLLLLETQDWNESGEYKYFSCLDEQHSTETNTVVFDFFILVRLKPDCKQLLKDNEFFYSQVCGKKKLKGLILPVKWEYDIPGFITNKDFVYLIDNKFIIKKGQMLNASTLMDVDNYYAQAGNLRPIISLSKYL